MSDGIEAMTRCERDDLVITLFEDALKDCALYKIDQVFIPNGHNLEDFPTLPRVHGGNRLVQKEMAYDSIH